MKKFFILSGLIFLCLFKCNAANIKLPDCYKIITSCVDDGKNIWIGTDKGLVKYNIAKRSNKIYTSSNSRLPCSYITAICVGKNRNVWIGTPKGLIRFDKYTFILLTKDNSSLPDNYITSLTLDNKGNLWLGTRMGLVKSTNNLKQCEIYNTTNSALKTGCIVSLSSDTSGNIWVGMHNNGLLWINGNDWKIFNKENSNLNALNVSYVAREKDGKYYVSTFDNGIFCADSTNFKPVVQPGFDFRAKRCRMIKSFDEHNWIYFIENSKSFFYLDSASNFKPYETPDMTKRG